MSNFFGITQKHHFILMYFVKIHSITSITCKRVWNFNSNSEMFDSVKTKFMKTCMIPPYKDVLVYKCNCFAFLKSKSSMLSLAVFFFNLTIQICWYCICTLEDHLLFKITKYASTHFLCKSKISSKNDSSMHKYESENV